MRKTLQEIRRYPSAVVGVFIIFVLIIVAIYSISAFTYEEAISLWRGGEEHWYNSPKNAAPLWKDSFSSKALPRTIDLKSNDDEVSVKTSPNRDEYTFTYAFDYQYDGFPKSIALFFSAEFEEKRPFVSIVMVTPDGREIEINELSIGKSENYFFEQDGSLTREFDGVSPEIALFSDPASQEPVPLKGVYTFKVNARTFEEGSTIDDVELVLYGQVHGWAGTDHLRREISVALIYGTPVALLFGLLAAVGVNLLTLIIAAIGGWYGGIVDSIIQRVTEINLTLPFLSILIMIGVFYSKSIWLILGVTILLSIFSSSIKTYRSMSMQIRESTFIEAAKAYGASDFRLIFKYMIPRMIPLLLPGLVISVPSFVFLEASLAVLGLGDPVLPTWGKVINDAQANSALYNGYYYWVLEPAVLLMITGFAFATVGFSLDRIFNPRLREL